ncbi:MAG: hypothetical protein DI533_00485 [Cereibacter sphaeroides]|uniref:Uncharacterized protein n=1 Tax=Cereibacter sphaeroides TaxID=1063 RepID=A0A2W5SB46_CERSP|nr:MAG: hypothetical protein DI533_00485 [Cereibacter sphaeroides]
MAARNTTILIPQRVWTELTASDVTAATWCNKGGSTIWITATAGTTPTSGDRSGAIPAAPNVITVSSFTLALLFPGVTGAVRIWAWAEIPTECFISHA